MANTCKNTITVIGLKDAPETFVKSLSKVMFGIDLDDMDPKKWDDDASVDGKTWYVSLTDEYRREGARAAQYNVLYLDEPYSKFGVTAPRYYLETKWQMPFDEIAKASEAFPNLTFHVAWWLLQDGPTGEFVMANGELEEWFQRKASWYLFDWPVIYPSISLLSAHLSYTLAQQATLRVGDAIALVEGLFRILEDNRFTTSPCQAYRDQAKVEETRKTLCTLLEQMRKAEEQLTFEGTFINDSRCETFYVVGYQVRGVVIR